MVETLERVDAWVRRRRMRFDRTFHGLFESFKSLERPLQVTDLFDVGPDKWNALLLLVLVLVRYIKKEFLKG